MSQPNLTLSVRNAGSEISVIDLQGELTARVEPMLTQAFARASEGCIRSVILNFSGLDYMNSGGIGLLVTLLIRANRQSQQLLAVGLSEHYRQIFELTRLDEAIRIFPAEAEAHAAARR